LVTDGPTVEELSDQLAVERSRLTTIGEALEGKVR